MSRSSSKFRGLVVMRRDGPSARRNFQTCGGSAKKRRQRVGVAGKVSLGVRAQEPKIISGYGTVTERASERVEQKPGRGGRPDLRDRLACGPGSERSPAVSEFLSEPRLDPHSSFPVSGAGRTPELPQKLLD